MMVIPVNIAAVSYLNTVPFIYGITHAKNLCANLLLANPSECAKLFIDGKVDIALVPVGALNELGNYQIVSDFCVGAEKNVRSVVVVSNSPINKINKIHLDNHSRTSVKLTQILARELWKITPEWTELSDYSIADDPKEGEAFLLIGDKVFDYEGKFKYSYDLAEEWYTLTKKPMVFAVWIARKDISDRAIEALDEALTLGVERIWEALVEHKHDDKEYAYEYLTRNIDYLFDAQKRKALELFWDKGLKIHPHATPG